MAYFSSQTEEEKKQGEGVAGAMRTAEAGMGQAAQGSGAPQPNQPAQPAQKRGSGWTNLKAYVGANQGEGERMAGNIGSQASNEATGNVSQIATAGQKQIEGLDQYQPKTTTAAYFADPTKIKAGDFQSYYEQSPDIAAYDSTANQPILQDWQQKVDATGSQGGRAALAGEYFGKDKADYGFGSRGLDAFLMGGSSLGDKMTGEQNRIYKQIGDTSKGYERVAQDKRNAAEGAEADFRTMFEASRAAEKARGDTAYSDMSKDAGLKAAYGSGDAEAFAKRGGEIDARQRALEQLIGRDFSGRDWAGTFATKQAAAQKAIDDATKARAASGGPGSAASSAAKYATPRTDPQSVMNNQEVSSNDPTAGMSEDEQQAYLEKKYWEQQGG